MSEGVGDVGVDLRCERRPGRVLLVGAGPGDLGLLTLRAREAIERADVILHDKLVPEGALALAREDALVLDVGKIGGGAQVPQDETHRLLLEHARAGRTIVRLKGGDPFVFGRGGEEAQLCAEHGIAFEVVPGITAGVAAPAYAGIPVTQRGLAAAVAFVTGHEDPAKDEAQLDWPALAAFPGTLVFYMGVRRLERICAALVEGGRPPDEPAAVVERGTFPDQRVVGGTLADLAQRAAAAGVRAPAVVVAGPVARLHEELTWRTPGPLAGASVVVTRARAQASALGSRLRALGARVVEAPALRLEPLAATVPDVGAFDLLVLTSANGVRRLFELVRDARALAGPRIAVVGPGTAAALRSRGVEADIVPERFVGEGLVDALRDVPVRRALVVRGRAAREIVPDALRERGAEVEVLTVYDTVAEPLDAGARDAALGADYVTFASGSAVRFFLEAVGGAQALRGGPRVVSIGPQTSAALRDAGLEPAVEAARHTPDGLVDALVEDTVRVSPGRAVRRGAG